MQGTHPLIRFLNQNRRQIRITIIAIVVFILILRFFNSLAEKKIEKETQEINVYVTELTSSDEHKKIIKNFLDFCIDKDEGNAYALLSSECKKEYFENVNDFKNKYILKYFSTNKSYIITYDLNDNEEYYYTVKILDDILSTGKIDNKSIIQDFKVVQENGQDKIIIEIN